MYSIWYLRQGRGLTLPTCSKKRCDRNRGLEPSHPISIKGREIRSPASGFLSGSRKSSPKFSSPPAAEGLTKGVNYMLYNRMWLIEPCTTPDPEQSRSPGASKFQGTV